jgi:hypothetical protein
MIMLSMVLPIVSYIRQRTDRANCINNLKNLTGAAQSHMLDHNRWPQFPVGSKAELKSTEEKWIKTLEPYGVTHKHWICPSVQRGLNGPDYTSDKHYRVDYWMSNFSPHPRAPYESMAQPWFVEKQDVHGNGNLVIFADGGVQPLNDLRREGDPY